MKKSVLYISLGLLVSLGTACSEDDESASNGGYQLRIGDSLNKKSNTIQLSQAIAYLEEVELEREVGDDEEVEIDIEDRFTVDLLTGTSTPEIPTVQIEPGTYHELELEFGDDDRLAFDIRGSYTDTAGTSYSFELSMIQELEFEIEAEGNGLVIPADYFTTLNVSFPVSDALASLDWTNAVKGANNTITINAQNNSSMLMAFLSALQLSVDD